MKLGATGHQHVPACALEQWRRALERIVMGSIRPTMGVCSVAVGADQEFGLAMLQHGIALDLVIPCQRYEAALPSEQARQCFVTLMRAAARRTTLPYPEPSEEAFLAAGLVVVERADQLVALWDGQPARGLGGTGDVVVYARTRGRPVSVVWPAELVRT